MAISPNKTRRRGDRAVMCRPRDVSALGSEESRWRYAPQGFKSLPRRQIFARYTKNGVPETVWIKTTISNTMKTIPLPSYMYFSGTTLVGTVPTIAPSPVTRANAIITPVKTSERNSYSAESAITASCVLFPNSAIVTNNNRCNKRRQIHGEKTMQLDSSKPVG